MINHAIIAVAENRSSVSRFAETLHRAGLQVTLVGRVDSTASWSRFVNRRIAAPITPDGFMAKLKSVIESHGEQSPWVFWTDETVLKWAMQFRGEPWVQKHLPVSDPQKFPAVFQKDAFQQVAQPAGVPVPPFVICNDLRDIDAAAAKIGFPLYLKRAVGSAGFDVQRVESPANLHALFEKVSGGGNVVVQRAIIGRLGKTTVLFDCGKPVCWFHTYAARIFPRPHGPSCAREFIVDEILDEAVHNIGGAIGMHGLAGIDWIRDDATGKPYVIEFNGRMTSAYHLGKYFNVDIPVALREMRAGRATTQPPRLTRQWPIVGMFPQDFIRSYVERDWPLFFQWITARAHSDTPWHDPGLIIAFLIRESQRFSGAIKRRLIPRFAKSTARHSPKPQNTAAAIPAPMI